MEGRGLGAGQSGGWIFGLGVAFFAEAGLEAFHVEVDDGGDVKGDELRDDESADDGEAEGLAHVAARAEAEGDGEGSHHGGHGGHQDGTETHEAGFEDGAVGRGVVVALRFQGEINHHDGVLFHDADEHEEADEAVDV